MIPKMRCFLCRLNYQHSEKLEILFLVLMLLLPLWLLLMLLMLLLLQERTLNLMTPLLLVLRLLL